MNRLDFRVPLGIGLMAIGILYLLQNFGIVDAALSIVWILLFAAAGLVFLYVYRQNREQWWALIPGFTMLGLAGLIVLNEYAPSGLQDLAVPIFLSIIGLSFALIYIQQRDYWWAIIPAGLLFSVAVMSGLEPLLDGGEALVGVFFLGGGLTFGILGVMKTPQGRMKWAFIPAALFIVMSGIFFSIALEAIQIVWAVGLVVVGVYFLFRGFRKREGAIKKETL
jgi:hypothetical protein